MNDSKALYQIKIRDTHLFNSVKRFLKDGYPERFACWIVDDEFPFQSLGVLNYLWIVDDEFPFQSLGVLNYHLIICFQSLGVLNYLLKTGMPVTIEGPYGCFDFDDTQPRQIWVGAGIGITPFVARLKELAKTPGEKPIDLFHSTADYNQVVIDKLTSAAEAAGVRFHLLVSGKDSRLDYAAISSAIPDWSLASIWFCGPPAFGHSLKNDFTANGLPAKHFYQELFQMR